MQLHSNNFSPSHLFSSDVFKTSRYLTAPLSIGCCLGIKISKTNIVHIFIYFLAFRVWPFMKSCDEHKLSTFRLVLEFNTLIFNGSVFRWVVIETAQLTTAMSLKLGRWNAFIYIIHKYIYTYVDPTHKS